MKIVRRRRILSSLLATAVGAALITVGAVAPAGAADDAAARIQRSGTVRVGTVAGAVPYFNRNLSSGKWEGFGPDFAADLGKDLDAKVEFVETTWGNAPLDLQAGKIDVMFGLAPSPARREVVNFSDTLFQNTYTAVCRRGFEPKSWQELDDPKVRIAVDIGSSHDQFVTSSLKNATVQRLENSPTATLALQSGKADCQVLVILLAKPLLKKRASLGTIHVPTPVYSAPVSIGLPKEADSALQARVNQWVAKARGSGQVREVILKNMEALAGVPANEFPPDVHF